MNTPSSPLRLTSVLTLLLLGGCNSAYREAFNRAREAAIRGDFLTAARSYRDACRAAPDDEDACGRVPLFSVKATDQAITTARPGCDAGELDRCLPPLLDARELLPEHVEVNAMLEKASQLHTERCASQWKEDGSVGSAVAGFACLQSRGHQLPVVAYQDLLASRANQLSERFATLATTARSRGTQGAAAALWTTAQCLAPSDTTGAEFQRAQQDFLSQSSIPVETRLDGPIYRPIAQSLSSPCMSLSSSLPRGSRCAESGTVSGQPSPLRLQVDAVVQRVVENITEDVNHVNYVSGTRQVPNPRFERARDRLGDAERELRRAERAFEEKDKECKKNPPAHDATCVGCPDSPPASTPACDEARRLDEERKQKVAEREEAGRALDGLPETVTEDVHDTFTYSVLTHDWRSPYQFTLRANTPGGSPPVQDAGELRFSDAEHVGFSPAGISADPLDVPPPHAFANAFLDRLAPHVFAAVQHDARVRGAARRSACNALPANWNTDWVQCWAEATLWENGSEPAPDEFLRLVASSTGASEQPRCR
ncbi:hypothetical protein CYFUS_006921 [Cystobacter fuscus]|uniref:Uncharacterized protein n=1 Tax=Cystobacter fuscus TaxID=43 RepID=A0A250JC38_9BACT|nr:hypothetical protein [Cystobacter fuscus]ATB41455.1 hypothetical protein CYFUS_006921 [Cystobacter fuscus]